MISKVSLASAAIVGASLLAVASASRRSPPAGASAPLALAAPDPEAAPPTSSAVTGAPVETAAPRSPCPASMAQVDGGCIDRYEAFLISRGPRGEEVRHRYYERPARDVVYEARSEAGAFPQAYVSRVEAADACANAGKRLCTMAEWQRACEGPRLTTYPYGDTRQPGRCNTDKAHLLTLRFGADARHWRYEDFNDPELDQEPGFLARAGAFDGCVGEYRVYDLVGNVHEWVSDTVDRELVARLGIDGTLRSYQPWQLGNGVFMGGFFSTREENGAGCGFVTVAHEPGYHDYSTGFRCCADAALP